MLDIEPGTPPASAAVLRSSVKASERVLGPFSRVSKSSVVTSVCVKSKLMLTWERTLASPTMGFKICSTRWRYTSSIFCLCMDCAEVMPMEASPAVSV